MDARMLNMSTRGLNNFLFYKVNLLYLTVMFIFVVLVIGVVSGLTMLADMQTGVFLGAVGMFIAVIVYLVLLIKNIIVARNVLKEEARK